MTPQFTQGERVRVCGAVPGLLSLLGCEGEILCAAIIVRMEVGGVVRTEINGRMVEGPLTVDVPFRLEDLPMLALANAECGEEKDVERVAHDDKVRDDRARGNRVRPTRELQRAKAGKRAIRSLRGLK